jgi:hypothetical protein
MEVSMSTNNKPVHKIRYGSVIASIWADNSTSGYFYNTTFCKIYKNGDKWCDTFSFEDRDLPNLAKAAAITRPNRAGPLLLLLKRGEPLSFANPTKS